MRNHTPFLGAVLILSAISVTSSYSMRKLAKANGNFAFNLYNKVIDKEDGKNEFFSPFSISTALSMACAGARGKTAAEMRHVLGFSKRKYHVHATFRAVLRSLAADQSNCSLALASGLFVDTGYAVRRSFPRLLANYYSASFKLLEFHNDPAASAHYINKWVDDKTNDKIQNIVTPDDVASVEVVLVNAIYFKGKWKSPFDPRRTVSMLFDIAAEEKTAVYMMTQIGRFRYSLNHRFGCQILELPYRGGRLAAYILLPKKKNGLSSLENKLTFRNVRSALAGLRMRRLSVGIPRFEMNVAKQLPDSLRAMGMKLAFTRAANFKGVGRGLYISDVIHKAFIGVDEYGTEAAAATVVLLRKSRPLPSLDEDFVAAHPFLFMIRDTKTGSILFLGRVIEPGQ